MDCDKFDQHVIDALYDELDELTHAALKRHVETCGRCADVWAGLRATREVGVLPLVEPPDDLEARILGAVTVAQQRAPWHKKALRGLAWAGSHAMRPQLAMAALFFLVIGSSLLLLRARPGTLGPVSVTERGAPAPDPAEAAAVAPASPAASAPAAIAGAEAPAATAAPAEQLERGPARRALGEAPAGKTDSTPSADDARASLAAARAVRDSAGCAAAVPKLDAVAATFSGTQSAADAMWDEASCYKQMGEAQKAQQLYLALRGTGYRGRAEQELAAAEANMSNQGNARSAAAAAPAAVAAAPAPPPAAKPAADARNAAGVSGGAAAPKAAKRPSSNGGTNPRAPASPAPRAADFNNALAP